MEVIKKKKHSDHLSMIDFFGEGGRELEMGKEQIEQRQSLENVAEVSLMSPKHISSSSQ